MNATIVRVTDNFNSLQSSSYYVADVTTVVTDDDHFVYVKSQIIYVIHKYNHVINVRKLYFTMMSR